LNVFHSLSRLDRAEFVLGADAETFATPLSDLVSTVRAKLRLPADLEFQLVCIDPDDVRHALTDDTKLAKAVHTTYQLGESMVTLEVTLASAGSAAGAMNVQRKSHSAPNSPNKSGLVSPPSFATAAAVAAPTSSLWAPPASFSGPSGTAMSFSAAAATSASTSAAAAASFLAYAGSESLTAPVQLPSWTELMPMIISFFEGWSSA
jgi:hypothetical protein